MDFPVKALRKKIIKFIRITERQLVVSPKISCEDRILLPNLQDVNNYYLHNLCNGTLTKQLLAVALPSSFKYTTLKPIRGNDELLLQKKKKWVPTNGILQECKHIVNNKVQRGMKKKKNWLFNAALHIINQTCLCYKQFCCTNNDTSKTNKNL